MSSIYKIFTDKAFGHKTTALQHKLSPKCFTPTSIAQTSHHPFPAGISTVNIDPFPSSLSTKILPPII